MCSSENCSRTLGPMSRGKGEFSGHDEISVSIKVIMSSISRKLQHT